MSRCKICQKYLKTYYGLKSKRHINSKRHKEAIEKIKKIEEEKIKKIKKIKDEKRKIINKEIIKIEIERRKNIPKIYCKYIIKHIIDYIDLDLETYSSLCLLSKIYYLIVKEKEPAKITKNIIFDLNLNKKFVTINTLTFRKKINMRKYKNYLFYCFCYFGNVQGIIHLIKNYNLNIISRNITATNFFLNNSDYSINKNLYQRYHSKNSYYSESNYLIYIDINYKYLSPLDLLVLGGNFNMIPILEEKTHEIDNYNKKESLKFIFNGMGGGGIFDLLLSLSIPLKFIFGINKDNIIDLLLENKLDMIYKYNKK